MKVLKQNAYDWTGWDLQELCWPGRVGGEESLYGGEGCCRFIRPSTLTEVMEFRDHVYNVSTLVGAEWHIRFPRPPCFIGALTSTRPAVSRVISLNVIQRTVKVQPKVFYKFVCPRRGLRRGTDTANAKSPAASKNTATVLQ
jgi:hypothetical protein